MAILNHVDVTSPEARAYLKHATAMRLALGDESDDPALADASGADAADGDDDGEIAALSPERIAELGAAEEFLLTVGVDGMGKRSSAYDYRVMGRGNQGVAATDLKRGVELAASFAVDDSDQIMAVTDGGQLIRFPVDTVRIAGRSTRGVRLIRLNEKENVVAVVRIQDAGDEDEGGENDGEHDGFDGEAGNPDASASDAGGAAED